MQVWGSPSFPAKFQVPACAGTTGTPQTSCHCPGPGPVSGAGPCSPDIRLWHLSYNTPAMPAYPHIEAYYARRQELIEFGGSDNELNIRPAFQNCLDAYCREHKERLVLIPELKAAGNVVPDGTVKDTLRMARGYWEAKDTHDDLDTEIQRKFDRGYPRDNIVFEDIGDGGAGAERRRGPAGGHGPPRRNCTVSSAASSTTNCPTSRSSARPRSSSRPTCRRCWKTCARPWPPPKRAARITAPGPWSSWPCAARASAPTFPRPTCGKCCSSTSSPRTSSCGFSPRTSSTGKTTWPTNWTNWRELSSPATVRREAIERLRAYYGAIGRAADEIADYAEKQQFLKAIYEDFYKAYNPAAADRLGVVYTPNEVVDFIIRGADHLLQKHFGKTLADENVQILDPATGTGTFITNLINYLPLDRLEHKYRHEIHANEVAILPYYIANLNIEYTYRERTGEYLEFRNLCFVDTLDNMDWQQRGATGGAVTRQGAFNLGGVSEENWIRVQEQNEKPISVIIGNPPYNATQSYWNDFNPNRAYPRD